MNSDTNELIKLLFDILASDNTISYNRLLAHSIGSNEAQLYQTLLSKMHYYVAKDMLDEEGYFYATSLDLQESTTLTKRQQIPAFKYLESIGLIETKKKGIPAKKYFRIVKNTSLLLELLEDGRKKINELHNKNKNTSQSKNITQEEQNVTTCNSSKKTSVSGLNSQEEQNVTTCSDKMEQQAETKCTNRQEQNVATCSDKMLRKTIYNKTNIINYNNQSIYQSNNDGLTDGLTEEDYRSLIKEHIDYDFLILPERKFGKENVDEIVEIMTETIVYNKNPVKIQGNLIPAEMVKNRFLNLNSEHIEYVMEKYRENFDGINNVKSYLITMLYNSYSTINHHYQQMALHDMYGGG